VVVLTNDESTAQAAQVPLLGRVVLPWLPQPGPAALLQQTCLPAHEQTSQPAPMAAHTLVCFSRRRPSL